MSRITCVLAVLSSPVLSYTWVQNTSLWAQFTTSTGKGAVDTYVDGLTALSTTNAKTCVKDYISINYAGMTSAKTLSEFCTATTLADVETILGAPSGTAPSTCSSTVNSVTTTHATDANARTHLSGFILQLKTNGAICAASSNAFTPSILSALAALGLALL
jgi:hypothetical protein